LNILIKSAFFAFLLLASITNANDSLVPPISSTNVVQCQGMIGLDFSEAGSEEQIAMVIVNSDDSAGFTMSFKFGNVANNVPNFQSGAKKIPLTKLILRHMSGILGEGLKDTIGLGTGRLIVLNGNEYLWDPGKADSVTTAPPTTETINYILELKASWAFPGYVIAGFYILPIEITITGKM
jgi:hypothetical protein